jgi:hypothetical protein
MPYNTDRSGAEKMIAKHFRQDSGDYYFYIKDIEGQLPISADFAEWCAKQLRQRIFVSWIFSSVLGGLAALWICWNVFFEGSFLVGLIAFIPALIISFCAHIFAIKLIFSLKKLLLIHLGWKRRGLQRALFAFGIFFRGNIILLAMIAFLFFRGITGYFGLIKWGVGSWSSDLEGVGFIALALAVVSAVILSTSLSFVPPDDTSAKP